MREHAYSNVHGVWIGHHAHNPQAIFFPVGPHEPIIQLHGLGLKVMVGVWVRVSNFFYGRTPTLTLSLANPNLALASY